MSKWSTSGHPGAAGLRQPGSGPARGWEASEDGAVHVYCINQHHAGVTVLTASAQPSWEGKARPSCKKDFKITYVNSYNAIILFFLDPYFKVRAGNELNRDRSGVERLPGVLSWGLLVSIPKPVLGNIHYDSLFLSPKS